MARISRSHLVVKDSVLWEEADSKVQGAERTVAANRSVHNTTRGVGGPLTRLPTTAILLRRVQNWSRTLGGVGTRREGDGWADSGLLAEALTCSCSRWAPRRARTGSCRVTVRAVQLAHGASR